MNCVLAALTVVSVGWADPDLAESQSDEQRKAEQAEFAKWAAEAAASYEIRLTAAPDAPLARRPEPVLKWSNPERGQDREVWTAAEPRRSVVRDRAEPYFTVQFR